MSANNTKAVWMLKCDIKKFFDSVDHEILLVLLKKKIRDNRILVLLETIIRSFHGEPNRGIPLGNLTSQLFSNVYLDPLDQFIKRDLRIKNYIRYADDFVILDRDLDKLSLILPKIQSFLETNLNMQLHQNKVIFRRWNQGIDFLGYVSFPHYTILRIHTRKRMFRKLRQKLKERNEGVIDGQTFEQSLNSYLYRLIIKF